MAPLLLNVGRLARPLPSPSCFTLVARFVFAEPGHRCGCCWISAADLHLQGKGRGAGVPCAVPLPRSAPRRGAILPRPHPRCVPRGRGRKRNRSAVRKGPGAGAGWEHGISGAGGGWGWGTEPRCSLHRPGTCPSPAGGAVEMGTEMAPWFLSLSGKNAAKPPKCPTAWWHRAAGTAVCSCVLPLRRVPLIIGARRESNRSPCSC